MAKILDQHGREIVVQRPAPRSVRATYDAAQTTDENTRHWAAADSLSADAAASPAVRQRLRNRARYERANNSYCSGMVSTLANDTIGTGPRLQLRTDDDNKNNEAEDAWKDWAAEVGFAEKLRCLRMAQAVDGEAFGVLNVNPRIGSPVKIDVSLVEADRVAAPNMTLTTDDRNADGITLDVYGRPQSYQILRHHPGGLTWADKVKYDTFPAERVLHFFRMERPGQNRGVPEIGPALPLYALLRRFTLAVIHSAEFSASVAAFLKSDAPPDTTETAEDEAFDLMEIVRNMLMTLPAGYDISQLKSEQPATTYDMFKRAILSEIARCLNMPYNVAAGDSSGYNYASGRLDHQTYFRAIDVERHRYELACDRIFRLWLREFALSPETRIGPADIRVMPEHEWQWDGREHVDPAKEANAAKTRLDANMTTLATEFARAGKDWQEELKQRGREVALMQELGLAVAVQPTTEPPGDDDESDD